MKKTLILFIFVISNLNYSQEIGFSYQFIVPVNHSAETIQFKKGHKIYVTKITEKEVFFSYYKFSEVKDTIQLKSINELNRKYYFDNKGFSTLGVGNENDGTQDDKVIKTFSLPTEDFNNYLTRLYPRFKGVSAGIFTVPFKLRINDFDFEQNVNIGMNLSFPFRMDRLKESEHLLTLTMGVGLATINLNPNNSDLEASDNENENRTASAFSFSGGLMYEFNSTINFGLQYGFDFLGNTDKGIRWKYDRKPWIGIGINIGVSVSNNDNSNAEN